MDSESDCSILEWVEDKEGFMDAGKYIEGVDNSKVCDKGFRYEEDNDGYDPLSGIEKKMSEQSGSVSHVELKPDASPSSTTPSKGYALKKWRRIKRDTNKIGDGGGVDADNTVIQDKLDLGANSSEQLQSSSERKKKGNSAVASADSVVRGLEGFGQLGYSGLVKAPPIFAVGVDLENGEDRSNKSSTPAKAQKTRVEASVAVGFPHEKLQARSINGKELVHPVLKDQQGKGSSAASKKFRGDKVNIEKENSHSSVESDPQRSNFVFMQEIYSTTNGIHDYNEDTYDGDLVTEQLGSSRLQGGYIKHGEAGCKDFLPEDAGADSSEVKNEKNRNNAYSAGVDHVVPSMVMLHSAIDALKNEVLKFTEMRENVSVDKLVQPLSPESADTSELLQSGEMPMFSFASQHLVLETEKRDSEAMDMESLFKKQIEADVQYLAITRTVQNLKAAALDQITILNEQKVLASKQSRLLDKLGDTEMKALVLNKEAKKLETFCEGITRADEALKMQKTICKYTSYFILQLVVLILVLGVFMFQLSPKYNVVPT